MNLRRLSSVLRLPLAVLICSQLVYLSGNLSPDDNSTFPTEVVISFFDRDGNESFDSGLPAVTPKGALIPHSSRVSPRADPILQVAPLELHATGPPNV